MNHKIDLSKEKEAIIRYRQQGLTVKEIAAIYGISRTSMARWIQEFGLSKSSERTDITTDEIMKLYANGQTANEIAKQFGVSCDMITKRLKKAGIQLNRAENIKKHFEKQHDLLWDQIQTDLNQNMTKQNVAKKYKMRIDNLNRLIEKHQYVRSYQGYTTFDEARNLLASSSGNKQRMLQGIVDLYELRGCWSTVKELSDYMQLSYVRTNELLNQFDLKRFIDDAKNRGQLVSTFESVLRHYCSHVILNERSLLNGLEIDFWCPDAGVGFEVNPTTSHSLDATEHFKKQRTYHQRKAIRAYDVQVPLVHIYDYDVFDSRRWDILQQMLSYRLNPDTIDMHGARECKASKIDTKLSNQFLDQYHLQGREKNSQYQYGLFLKDELVSVMTFGNGRYQSDCVELIRYAVRYDIGIIGGFKKLFQFAVRDMNLQDIYVMSYLSMDQIWHHPVIYQTAGFESYGFTQPGYVWVNSRTQQVLPRYAVQTKNRNKLFPDDYALCEKDCMIKHGYMRVFNAGNMIWMKRV